MITRQLVDLGATILIVGRNKNDLDRVAKEHPEQIVGLCADLSDPSQVDHLIKRITENHPEISVMVNNAGVQFEADLLSPAAQDHIANARTEIAVNLDAPVALTIGLLPILRTHDHATVVNISSALAIAPKEASPVYCATKAAIRNFSKSLRYQCETSAPNIRVTEVLMALVDTDMTQGRGSGKITPKDAAANVLAGIRAGRSEVWVGKSRLLRILDRISPALSHRILR
nr:SDR family NAD(P)-dependent oxidoreductase [Roseovarius sp. Pro17]